MSRLLSAAVLSVLCALAVSGCGSSSDPLPTAPTPVALTEAFDGSINRNGAATHTFIVQTAGTVTATLSALAAGDATTVGLSMGTWNTTTLTCQIILANDAAHSVLADGTAASTIIGTASSVGSFCVRVYDVGQLSASTPASYTVSVTHF